MHDSDPRVREPGAAGGWITPRRAAAFAALGVGLALLRCAPRRAAGIECVFNGECEQPNICSAGVCRTPCANDRDCQLGTSCSPSPIYNVSVCLPPDTERYCVYASDCETLGPYVCSASGRCVPQCRCEYDCRAYSDTARCIAINPGGAMPIGGCENNPHVDAGPSPVVLTCSDAGVAD